MEPNTVEAVGEQHIKQAGMPSVGRKKRSGKLVNIVGLTTIAGVGLAFALMSNGGARAPAGKAKPGNAEVANHLAPLVIEKPPPLAEPAALPLVSTANAAPTAPAASATPAHPAALGRHLPTWQERKMGFSDSPDGDSAAHLSMAAASAVETSHAALATADGAMLPKPAAGDLAARLEPTTFRPARASLLPNRDFLLAKGASFDCVLDTHLVSTLPGAATCHTDEDVYSDNGHVLLMGKNTLLTGEYSGAVRHGESRMFTLFSRAKTPDGVIVDLNSPATDALGASGIEGWVDTQFGKRFGAALMIALLQDATALAVTRKSGGGGQNTLVLGNTTQAGGAMAEKALDASVNIPPVLYVNYGAHIRVVLARDLDFSGVYALKPVAP